MDEVTKAYIAGRLDYSTFYINPTQRGAENYAIGINIMIDDPDSLDFFEKNTNIKFRKNKPRKIQGSNFYGYSRIGHIVGEEAVILVSLVFDYLIRKKKHAEILKEYGNGGFGGTRRRLPEYLVKKRRELFLKMKELNTMGRKGISRFQEDKKPYKSSLFDAFDDKEAMEVGTKHVVKPSIFDDFLP